MRRIPALFACSIAFGVLTACSEGVKAPLAQIAAPPAAVNAGSYVLLNASASQDPQGRPLTYAWSFVERPLGSNATLLDEHTATPSFLADVPGTYILQLVVSNSLLTSTASQVTVQVLTCAANPPAIASPLLASKNPLNIGETSQLTANVTDADNESPCNLNQTLSYEWVIIQQPAGSTATLNNKRSETPSLIPDKTGDYKVRLTVTDSTGLSSEPKTVILTANCGVGTPVVAPTATPNATHPNVAVQLAANGSDPDTACGVAPTLTYQWSVRATPVGATATFSSSDSANPVFIADKRGSYELGVVATDGTGRSSPEGVVSVNVDAPCSKPVLSNLRFTAGGQTTAFKGDRIDLAVDATPGNCGLISSQLTYNWTLLAPPGSAAALKSSSSAAPSFIADVAGGNFTVSVTATDAEGNASNAATLTISVSTCGSSPILAAISDMAGPRPFDDHTFQAVPAAGRTTFSDDDTSGCPARFVGQYSFTWSVVSSAPNVGYAFNNTDGATVKFTPGGNAVYSVRLVVSSPTKSAEFMTLVGVSCPDVVPKAGTLLIASSTPGYAPGKFFLGDTAMLSATPSSLCYSDGSTPYSYLWSLQKPSGAAVALSSVTAAQPTFTVDGADSTWQATVIVVDKLGNRSDPTKGTAAFKSETCGMNPATARFIDTRVGVSPFGAFDPHDLQATGFSADDDPAICPARFNNPSYSFTNLRMTPPSGATRWSFVPSSSSAGRFEAGENGSFVVSADATGSRSGVTGPGSFIIVVSCADPTPATTQPALKATSDPEGVTVTGKFFRDESVMVATTPSGACYTGTNLRPTYEWSFGSGTTDTLASFSDPTAVTPEFIVNESGAVYDVHVEVKDQWGNGPGSSSGTLVAETCGKNPVVVSATAARTSGTLAFDPWTVSASGSSADDDPARCPQPRFPQTYTFTWAVSSVPAGASSYEISATTGPQTVFTKGEPAAGTYGISATATASKSGLQGQGTASIATATCAKPGPTFPSIISIAQVTPAAPDPYYAGNPGKFFTNDGVGLASPPAAFACYSNQALAGASYVWSLVTSLPPTPPIAQTPDAPLTASFTADRANRNYRARVDARDHWGNGGFQQRDFASGNCGASPISAAITAAQFNGARPMDDWTLTGVGASGPFFSADSDPSQCPARFAPTYQFAWSLNPDTGGGIPPGNFSSSSVNPTTFTPGNHRSYSVHLVVSGNGQSGTANQTFDANCAPPLVAAPVVAEVNGAPPPPAIFAGDMVRVATPVTSQCFANPTPSSLSYAYTLLLAGAPAPEPFSPSANDAQPSFQPQAFGGTYDVSVAVRDASSQSSSSAAPLRIVVSTCGVAEPSVSASVATQHFDAIVQQVSGGAATTAPLTLTQTAPSLTSVATVDPGGAPHSVAVPFYLNGEIGVDVTLSIPASCPNVRFAGARLIDPHFALVPTDQWSQPGPTTLTAGQPLHFSFTPLVGDERDAGGTLNPGYYFLSLDVAYGSTSQPVTGIVSPTQINVSGRCGLNAPFVDAQFDPLPPQAVGTVVTGTSLATDADNETLMLFPATPDPGTSSGCGLNQTLSYAWTFASKPGTSLATLAPPDATVTHFTPDVAGAYSVQLVVGDGTTSGVAGNGKTSATFPYTAGP